MPVGSPSSLTIRRLAITWSSAVPTTARVVAEAALDLGGDQVAALFEGAGQAGRALRLQGDRRGLLARLGVEVRLPAEEGVLDDLHEALPGVRLRSHSAMAAAAFARVFAVTFPAPAAQRLQAATAVAMARSALAPCLIRRGRWRG
jgi:hypothetical protein